MTRGHLDTGRFHAFELRMHTSAGLESVRREVLLTSFGWLLFVASLLLPIAVVRDLKTAPWLIAPHALIEAALLTVWLCRARLSSGAIAKTMLAALYLIGTLALLRLGIVGTNFLAYALVVVATPMIFGQRAGWLAAGLCGVTCVVIGALAVSGALSFQLGIDEYASAASSWFYTGASFAAFAAVTVALSATVHRKIDQLVRSEVARRQMLKTSNERLAEANQRLREVNEHLESRFAERTQRLEQANRELESFSYTVSHDLRSPLQVIEGFSALALQEDGLRMPHKTREYMHRIQASARRMHDMIGQLLAFSQLATVPLHTAQTNLSDLARSILTDLQVTEPSRQVESNVQSSMSANVDPALIVNVLHNLLANAWKFTARVSHPRIEFTRHDDGREWVYVVRDNGVGFCDSKAQRLFQPFARLHDKREFSGNGVGLATARRIIERHGGRIWARSSPGEGAEFFFTLRADEAVTVVDPSPVRHAAGGQ